jgi:hypothetical protein
LHSILDTKKGQSRARFRPHGPSVFKATAQNKEGSSFIRAAFLWIG